MYQLHGIQAPRGMSYVTIEEHAAAFRRWAGVELDERLPAPQIFDDLDDYNEVRIDGLRRDVVSGVKDLSPDTQGQVFYNVEFDRIELELDLDIFEALMDEDAPHARFCFAHELGHLVLHSTLAYTLANASEHERAALMRTSKNHQPYEDTEWQANAFGGALLMPFLVVHELQAHYPTDVALKAAMMEHFGVTPKAVDIRLKVIRERLEKFSMLLPCC